jgi:polyphosphate kinase
MSDSTPYFNRELSWLSFNYRVLREAADPSVPLYERIKFLAIYTANLEEFFRVRVATLKKLDRLRHARHKKELDFEPSALVAEINETVTRQHYEFEQLFANSVLPALREHGVVLYRQEPLPEEHQKEVVHFFKSRVLSYLQPLFITGSRGRKPFMENDALYLAVVLRQKHKPAPADEKVITYVNVPSAALGRFVPLPGRDGKHYFIFLEDVVRCNLHTIFPGYEVLDAYGIKMDRSGDLDIEDEYSGDLVEKVKQQLPRRKTGEPTRFIYEEGMPADVLDFLVQHLELNREDLVTGGQHQNMDDLMKLPNPLAPALQYEPLPPLGVADLDATDSLFEAIRDRDRMLHFPYHSYDYVLRFFNEAAIDPCVREVKVTLYRIASQSLIANALITAAKNGKQVTVFVEVKARFDEANNLRWAAEMEAAGVRIIYSIPGLKVHAKVALVHREAPDGRTEGYAYFGTGNFNERTAEIYADDGLLTAHPGMVAELGRVFTHLAGKPAEMTFEHLLVAQFNLQDRFLELLDREIAAARKGETARAVLKFNNLEDKVMIDKLYEASAAGVAVSLIVRGICCLVPGVAGVSDNITVTRIVDRYLEHARVFWFHHGGAEEIYLSSADWMKRNLYKRIEVGFPVYDEAIKAELKQMLTFQLEDTVKGTHLDAEGRNQPIQSRKKHKVPAQLATYNWLRDREVPAGKQGGAGAA